MNLKKPQRPFFSNYLRKKRIQAIKPYLKGNILDLGCGRTLIPHLLKQDQIYIGIDQNPEVLKRIREKYPNIDFQQKNLETDEISVYQLFDTVLLLAVIEHLENPHNILCQISKFLTQNGNLIITTPSPLGGKIHALGSDLHLFSKRAVEDHKHFYSMKYLATFIQYYGLKQVHRKFFLLGGNQLFVFQKNN